MKATLKTIVSQPSWVLRSSSVELAITQLGGHMAPVVFYRTSRRSVQPYYISPWQSEGVKITEPVLVPLRGDFFCAPFGGNANAYRGVKYPCHGETAVRKWTLADSERGGGVSSLTLRMKSKLTGGKITRKLSLIDGQNVVYCSSTLEGFSGPMPLGHHCTLAMPEKEGSLRVATSAIQFGMTNPTPPGQPAAGEYYSIIPNKKFKSLSRVPVAWPREGSGDFSAFPARKGFTDMLAVFNKPAATKPAWTAAAFDDEGFLWFSLKDPAVLPMTLLWVSNCGRHAAPWNGRNRCLGLEDVCGLFADGIAPSAKPNALNRAGIATCVKLSPKKSTTVNHIQGVVKIPRGFKKVRSAAFAAGEVTFTSITGRRVTAAVNHEFLKTGSMV